MKFLASPLIVASALTSIFASPSLLPKPPSRPRSPKPAMSPELLPPMASSRLVAVRSSPPIVGPGAHHHRHDRLNFYDEFNPLGDASRYGSSYTPTTACAHLVSVRIRKFYNKNLYLWTE
ncbi:hypothetical protein QC764_306157 [Podospora pseudoanserina]|uniref:Uncharacterized protein n=1 Tax=Podospora pseudoanserina TaxID=2609844 RepID=A0ABR0IEH2_9PEZI|nr:hypothetical protein QC764_306157 [Podospora pseudoanserina]